MTSGVCVCVCERVCVCVCSVLSNYFETPWAVACQAPRSMEFSRQEYWRGCHVLFQGLHWQADALPLRHLAHPNFCYAPLLMSPVLLRTE